MLMTFDDDMNETRTFLWRTNSRVMVCVVKSKDRDILRVSGRSPLSHPTSVRHAPGLLAPAPGYLRLKRC